MNPIRTLRRLAAVLAGLAAAALAFAAATPAAFAYRLPPSGGGGPAPAQSPVHAMVTGGMPGWQITLIAAAAAALAAVLAVRADRARAARHMTAPTS